MLKKIITIVLYVALGLYALMMFAGVISSGAVIAIVFVAIVAGYVGCMIASIKCSKRLEKYREVILQDAEYKLTKRDKPLFLAMMANLPFYFIYFVLSLIPMDFPALWVIAGLPCALISALRPINKNYQTYNFLTNKSKLYWLLQVILAVVLWLGGRMIILVGVLG